MAFINGYLPALEFSKNWESPKDFPTLETEEEEVRKNLQLLHDETKDFINNKLIPFLWSDFARTWEDYDPEKEYQVGDRVFYDGSSYICKVACKGILPTNESYWQLIAMGGEVSAAFYDELNKLKANISISAAELRAEMTDIDDRLSGELSATAERLTSQFEDGDKTSISRIEQTATEIRQEVQDVATGLESQIRQTAEGFETQVSDIQGDLSTLEQTADQLKINVQTAQGDIASLKVESDEIRLGLRDAEGNITALTETAQGIEARVESNQNEIANVNLRADEITSEVTSLRDVVTGMGTGGDAGVEILRSEIQQTADAIRAEVSAQDKEAMDVLRGELTVKANEIRAEVEEVRKEIGTGGGENLETLRGEIEVKANEIKAEVSREIATVAEDLDAASKEIVAVYRELDDLSDDISAVSRKVDTAKSELQIDADSIRAEVEAVSKEVLDFGDEIGEVIKSVEETKSSVTQTATDILSVVEENRTEVLAADKVLEESLRSEIKQTADSIKMEVKSSTGADGQTYASITLRVGEETYTGQILLDGNVDVSGQLSADALYAAMGDIADLTVDKFSTSRRIVKYLNRDTSDDNYVTALDEELAFVSGEYAGGTTQARNPNGLKLYWESNPDAADVVLGTDGYPEKNGVRIFTTTSVTSWPVYVYNYAEQVKARFAFETWGDIYTPVLTMGAGNSSGRNRGYIVKSVNGLEIIYKANTGNDIGIRMGTGGYMDLFGLRKPTNIDFTSGGFSVTMEGGLKETYSFRVSDGILYITDSSGHETKVTGV